MAGLSKEKNKNGREYWRVTFRDNAGRQRFIRLGSTTKEYGTIVKNNVAKLVSCSKTGIAFDDALSRWIVSIPAELRSRLEGVGLIPRNEQDGESDSISLQAFVLAYLEKRKTDCAASTLRKIKSALNNLIRFFDGKGLGDMSLSEITPIHGNEYRWHRLETQSEATMTKDVKAAKQLLKEAKLSGYLKENPFENVRGGDDSNSENQHYVNAESLKRILSFCPNSEWRTIVALGRLGGIRIPSELSQMKWANVDWDAGRILIHSPKTKKKKATRKILLFPELRQVLLDHLEHFGGESEYVIVDPRLRDSNSNLRTEFGRILMKAGVEKYPRPFNNLRSSFITDLLNSDNARLANIRNVAYLAGNSPKTILRHYAQMLGDRLDEAISSDPFSIGSHNSGNISGNIWWEDSSSTPLDTARQNYQETKKPRENGAFCHAVSKAVKSQVTPTGFEPVLPA